MVNNLTIPLLTGALSVSVIINILLIKSLKRLKPTTSQYLLPLSEEDDINEEEVNAVLLPILVEIEEKRKQRKLVKNFEEDLKKRLNDLKKKGIKDKKK